MEGRNLWIKKRKGRPLDLDPTLLHILRGTYLKLSLMVLQESRVQSKTFGKSPHVSATKNTSHNKYDNKLSQQFKAK